MDKNKVEIHKFLHDPPFQYEVRKRHNLESIGFNRVNSSIYSGLLWDKKYLSTSIRSNVLFIYLIVDIYMET